MSDAPEKLDVIELIKGCVKLLNHEQLGKLTHLYAALIIAKNGVAQDSCTLVAARTIAVARSDFPEETCSKFTEMVGKAPSIISEIHSILGQVTSLIGADTEANRNNSDKRVAWVDFVGKGFSETFFVLNADDSEMLRQAAKTKLGDKKSDCKLFEYEIYLLAACLCEKSFKSHDITMVLKSKWETKGERHLSNVTTSKNHCQMEHWIKLISRGEGSYGIYSITREGWQKIVELTGLKEQISLTPSSAACDR